jgi:hypothetical protein
MPDWDNDIHRGEARVRSHKDPLVSFRFFTARATARAGKIGLTGNLTPEYLQQVWKAQQGVCPLTGWVLYLPASSRGFSERSTRNASLDRLDNAKGYIEGNVRFVALIANRARSEWTDLDVIEFCHAVAKRHSADNIE